MKKVTLLIITLIFLSLTFSLNMVSASNETNSSNWKVINIDGVDFKLPPEYEGGHFSGETNHTTYMLETVFDFSINSMYNKARLEDEYGYASTDEDLTSFDKKTVGKHIVILLHSYNSICEHNVTYAFFVVNKTIFSISYNGINLTNNLKKMISSTPKSELSKKKFFKRLDEAQKDYLEDQREYEEYYEYTESYRSNMRNNYKHHNHDFASYYIAYRISRYFMKK